MEDDNKPVEDEELEQEEIETTGIEDDEPESKDEGGDSEEVDEPESEEPEKEETEEEEPEEQPVSRRESKRIQSLLEKMRVGKDDGPEPNQQRQAQFKNEPIIPEGDYDLDQVNKMANDYAQDLYQKGMSEAQVQNQVYADRTMFSTRLEIDMPRITSKYEFLDEESSDFNPGIADFVNRMYLNTVGYDPNMGVPTTNKDLRYPDFVEGIMEMVGMLSNGKVAETTKNVAKQAARTGIRPGGVQQRASYQGDDPSKMTDAQLAEAIKQNLGR